MVKAGPSETQSLPSFLRKLARKKIKVSPGIRAPPGVNAGAPLPAPLNFFFLRPAYTIMIYNAQSLYKKAGKGVIKP
ncbi:MAG: hypothetical protein IKR64_03515 [Treponema sp.]|nr:hypothetical protein [Treponema sp.]